MMGKTKTAFEYVDEIRDLYKQLKSSPNDKKLKKTYDNRVSVWVKKLDLTVFVAQNEQLPWKNEELLLNTHPMLLKKDCHYDQVGDYQVYYSGSGVEGWIPIVYERKGGKKGCEDIYGTLNNPEHCDTFYDEIERYYNDDRFTSMIVIAECNLPAYCLFSPPFIGNTRNVHHIGTSTESRIGKVASLHIRGVPVIWAGTRLMAITMFKALNRQWLIKNCPTILKLDVEPYSDFLFLKEKKARLEAELEAVNASLARTMALNNEGIEVEA
jgi:hypothetical protein